MASNITNTLSNTAINVPIVVKSHKNTMIVWHYMENYVITYLYSSELD